MKLAHGSNGRRTCVWVLTIGPWKAEIAQLTSLRSASFAEVVLAPGVHVNQVFKQRCVLLRLESTDARSFGTVLVSSPRQVAQLVRVAHDVQRPYDVTINLEHRSLHRSLGCVHDDTGQTIDGPQPHSEVLAPPRVCASARCALRTDLLQVPNPNTVKSGTPPSSGTSWLQ